MQYCPVCKGVSVGTLGHTHIVDPLILNESVSHGTLINEDLIPKFERVLDVVAPREAGALRAWFDGQSGDAEDHDEYVMKLMDALDEAAPEGWRFGLVEGDGSDFGFWELGCEVCGTTDRNNEGELINHTEEECFK